MASRRWGLRAMALDLVQRFILYRVIERTLQNISPSTFIIFHVCQLFVVTIVEKYVSTLHPPRKR